MLHAYTSSLPRGLHGTVHSLKFKREDIHTRLCLIDDGKCRSAGIEPAAKGCGLRPFCLNLGIYVIVAETNQSFFKFAT